jgi:ribonuclease R
MFDPARRWRGGVRELIWKGAHAPENGDFCIAEVPDYGPALLVEVLGAEDRPAWDDDTVASQFRLRRGFPADAEREAQALREPGPRDLRGRLDLRSELVFTIDPADARDHDDALSVRALGNGRHEVGIHIADVSHYVRPDSALDREARARGTSCYLPGGVVPMLPERLSSDLCSLHEGRDRLALTVLVELDREGLHHSVKFAESVIRCRVGLHYEEVQDAIDGTHPRTDDVQGALEMLLPLARALRRRRMAGGALALEVPETKARVDDAGVPIAIERRAHLESHELIEEFMLLANQCVGAEGARRRAGVLYRIHDAPSPERLAELDVMLRALRLPRLGNVSQPGPALQALLAASLDPPHRRLLHRLVLRTLARACYLETDHGHFGLGSREYVHFTSPIRRYPDLHNHRRVREWIQGRRDAAWEPLQLAGLALQCSATEQNATAAEREATRVKSLRHLEGRLGEVTSGIITGIILSGFFVELDDTPVDGFVRLAHGFGDQFDLDGSGVRLVGRRTRRRFTLGDSVRVQIARVDIPARECDFALDEPTRRATRRRSSRRR